MIRLVCNGECLDIPKDAKMSLKKTNPLFAFDSITCDRTTSFDLPKTPKNNRVFGLAYDPATNGAGMRRRFNAQLVNGVCVKDGYLYVDSFSKTYKAIFVTGELVGLKAIKEFGKLADTIKMTDVATYGGTPISASSTPSGWQNVNYLREDGSSIHPSMGMAYLLNSAANAKRIKVSLPDAINNVRLIPAEVSTLKTTDVSLNSSVIDSSQPSTSTPSSPYNKVATSVDELFSTYDGHAHVKLIGVDQYYCIRHFVPLQDIKVTFPSSWSNNYFIVSFEAISGNYEFIGDWGFERQFRGNIALTTYSGTPLAGRTITIEKGTPFIIVNEKDYVLKKTLDYVDMGWNFALGNSFPFSHTLSMSGGDVSAGSVVRLQDNIPDITLTDMFKVVAALTGKVLNYTDADGVKFDDLALASWKMVDISDKLVDMGEIRRTFADYGQNNRITFDRDEWVKYPMERVYTIDNVNIQEDKVLTSIPFNEGNGDGVLYVSSGDKMTLGVCSTSTYMVRCSLPENSGIKSLCTQSTSVKARVNISQYEYEKITPKTKLLLNGVLYVWTESTWSNHIAEFTLAKV